MKTEINSHLIVVRNTLVSFSSTLSFNVFN